MINDSMFVYFKKRFPKSFKYLPIVKFVTFLFILITLKIDYQTYYLVLSSSIFEEESLILASIKFYSQYSFCFYFVIITYEFVLSVYVTLKASSPVRNKKSPTRRHHSEPLPRKSNRPVIQRRNTR